MREMIDGLLGKQVDNCKAPDAGNCMPAFLSLGTTFMSPSRLALMQQSPDLQPADIVAPKARPIVHCRACRELHSHR